MSASVRVSASAPLKPMDKPSSSSMNNGSNLLDAKAKLVAAASALVPVSYPSSKHLASKSSPINHTQPRAHSGLVRSGSRVQARPFTAPSASSSASASSDNESDSNDSESVAENEDEVMRSCVTDNASVAKNEEKIKCGGCRRRVKVSGVSMVNVSNGRGSNVELSLCSSCVECKPSPRIQAEMDTYKRSILIAVFKSEEGSHPFTTYIVERLLEGGRLASEALQQDCMKVCGKQTGYPFLNYVARRPSSSTIEIVYHVLASGVDPNARPRDRRRQSPTPLDDAAFYGNVDMILTLHAAADLKPFSKSCSVGAYSIACSDSYWKPLPKLEDGQVQRTRDEYVLANLLCLLSLLYNTIRGVCIPVRGEPVQQARVRKAKMMSAQRTKQIEDGLRTLLEEYEHELSKQYQRAKEERATEAEMLSEAASAEERGTALKQIHKAKFNGLQAAYQLLMHAMEHADDDEFGAPSVEDAPTFEFELDPMHHASASAIHHDLVAAVTNLAHSARNIDADQLSKSEVLQCIKSASALWKWMLQQWRALKGLKLAKQASKRKRTVDEEEEEESEVDDDGDEEEDEDDDENEAEEEGSEEQKEEDDTQQQQVKINAERNVRQRTKENQDVASAANKNADADVNSDVDVNVAVTSDVDVKATVAMDTAMEQQGEHDYAAAAVTAEDAAGVDDVDDDDDDDDDHPGFAIDYDEPLRMDVTSTLILASDSHAAAAEQADIASPDEVSAAKEKEAQTEEEESAQLMDVDDGHVEGEHQHEEATASIAEPNSEEPLPASASSASESLLPPSPAPAPEASATDNAAESDADENHAGAMENTHDVEQKQENEAEVRMNEKQDSSDPSESHSSALLDPTPTISSPTNADVIQNESEGVDEQQPATEASPPSVEAPSQTSTEEVQGPVADDTTQESVDAVKQVNATEQAPEAAEPTSMEEPEPEEAAEQAQPPQPASAPSSPVRLSLEPGSCQAQVHSPSSPKPNTVADDANSDLSPGRPSQSTQSHECDDSDSEVGDSMEDDQEDDTQSSHHEEGEGEGTEMNCNTSRAEGEPMEVTTSTDITITQQVEGHDSSRFGTLHTGTGTMSLDDRLVGLEEVHALERQLMAERHAKERQELDERHHKDRQRLVSMLCSPKSPEPAENNTTDA